MNTLSTAADELAGILELFGKQLLADTARFRTGHSALITKLVSVIMLSMPTMLTPDVVRFELHDGIPVIRLLIDQPHEATAEGWSLMSRVTLCVIDGPGDAGYLFPRIGIDTPHGWDEATDNEGGAHVRFGMTAADGFFARAV